MAAHKSLATAILAWLDERRASLPADLAEGLEVGQQTIADAFGVTIEQARASKKGALEKAWAAASAPGAVAAAAAAPAPAPPSAAAEDEMPPLEEEAPPSHVASAEDEAAAEAAKAAGNAALEASQLGRAEELYTQAITLAPAAKNSHIYFSNRAMARLKLGDAAGSAGAFFFVCGVLLGGGHLYLQAMRPAPPSFHPHARPHHTHTHVHMQRMPAPRSAFPPPTQRAGPDLALPSPSWATWKRLRLRLNAAFPLTLAAGL